MSAQICLTPTNLPMQTPSNVQRMRLLVESLETRLAMANDLSLMIQVQDKPLGGEIAPHFSVDIELRFDVGVVNNSNKVFRPGVVTLELGGGVTTPASPVLVEVLPQTQKLASFEVGALRFLAHPTEPYVFATIPKTNSLAIFNTQTLKLEANFFVGSRPYGMALSNDGNTLYVAGSTSQFLSVVDWRARTIPRKLTLPEPPLDVEVGSDGRLYVLCNQTLMQIDPSTGRKVGPDFPVYVYSGELAISRDKDRLYYGDFGLSPASLYQFDITTPTPKLLWESDHGITSGDNGQAVAISNDGSFVSYAAGYGQTGYRIAKYRTSDMAIEGTFDTGPYPRETAGIIACRTFAVQILLFFFNLS